MITLWSAESKLYLKSKPMASEAFSTIMDVNYFQNLF